MPVDLAEPIEVVDIDGTFATMYPVVGTDMLQPVSIRLFADNGHVLYVDEEGLLKDSPRINRRLTVCHHGARYGDRLYGVGIIVCEDSEGTIHDMSDAEHYAQAYGDVLGLHASTGMMLA